MTQARRGSARHSKPEQTHLVAVGIVLLNCPRNSSDRDWLRLPSLKFICPDHGEVVAFWNLAPLQAVG